MKKEIYCRIVCMLSLLTVIQSTAFAEWPERQINYIIPFGPGGESDVSARIQQSFFKSKFGQSLVISYKPGGGGSVGWSQLNKQSDDGYTIMGVNIPHVILQPAKANAGYETNDINIFYMFHYTPDAVVVKDNSPFKTLWDLIDYAKSNPGKLTMSGSGKASANHFAQINFDKMANIKTTYVPFKGTGASMTALLGGQVKAAWGFTTAGANHRGKVRLLAVAMDQRHPLFPDVPTFKELGFDISGGAYRGMAVPEGVSGSTRKELSDAFGALNKDKSFIQKMLDSGFTLLDIPYEDMDEFIKEKSDYYITLATEAGLLD